MASTQSPVHWLLAMAALSALLISHTAVAEGQPFERVLEKLDTIERTVGPVPDEPNLSIIGTVESIQQALSPNLTRIDPRYVWAGLIASHLIDENNWAFIPDAPQFYLALNNGSLEQTKARVQGFRDQAKIIEFDIDIPTGSTVSIFDHYFLNQFREQNVPLPTLYVVSSNKKLLINATIERYQYNEFATSDVFAQSNAGYSTSVDFELLNCLDLVNYAVHCAAPTAGYSWDTFIPR